MSEMTGLELLMAYEAKRQAIYANLRLRDGGPHNNALRAFLGNPDSSYTMKARCEVIAAWFKSLNGRDVAPEAIFNYSPTGELYWVFQWFDSACQWLGSADMDEATAERILACAEVLDDA